MGNQSNNKKLSRKRRWKEHQKYFQNVGRREDPYVSIPRRMKLFLTVHWKGVVILLVPLLAIAILLPLPPKPYQWCAYCLIVMAIWWVCECLPLPVTSFLPVVIFPLVGVMDTRATCQCYCNGSILMFVGSLVFAAAVEASGLHIRMALCAIRCIGYSHYKLLFAMSFITMFVSMWITNTAACTMMVPIVFAVLHVLEDQKLMQIYVTKAEGQQEASDLTTCYFCAIAFSASIGGIGTLVGTATNLTFKGLFQKEFPEAPEYLSFPLFSAFSVPLMLGLELSMYFYFIVYYFGFLRPGSKAAKGALMTERGIKAAKNKVESDYKALGTLTFHEFMVLFLFGGAILLFFGRSPQVFTGWGDALSGFFGKDKKFITDSVLAFFVCFLMFLLPSNLKIFRNCSAKIKEKLPKGRIPSVLDWKVTQSTLPWSYMFLLGGGFALSTAANKDHSDLNGKIGDVLAHMKSLPDSVIILLLTIVSILITQFASNVAVCNVIVPIAMTLAVKIQKNPLKYCMVCGFTASFCFLLPVGTPPNLVVQSVAKVPTGKMIIAGLGPSLATIILMWACITFWAPVIWSDINKFPEWTSVPPPPGFL